MAYRVRGRGQFTAPTSRSGKAYIYSGRRVLLKGDNFELAWNGPQLVAEILNEVSGALEKLSDQALAYMQQIVPVDKGTLRDSCYVRVSTEGTRLRIEIGATAYYAVYVELGTSRHSAQPFIRPTYDLIVSMLPQLLKREVGRRGR